MKDVHGVAIYCFVSVCGHLLRLRPGYILDFSTSSLPLNRSLECRWKVPMSARSYFARVTENLPRHPDCWYDYVEVFGQRFCGGHNNSLAMMKVNVERNFLLKPHSDLVFRSSGRTSRDKNFSIEFSRSGFTFHLKRFPY